MADPRATRSGEVPVSPVQARAVAGPTTATRIEEVTATSWRCSDDAARAGGAAASGSEVEASGASRCPGAPAVEPIPTSASRYGVSTSTVRAEVSTSQVDSPATIRRAVASRAAASPGTVRVTATRSTWDPARSSAEAM